MSDGTFKRLINRVISDIIMSCLEKSVESIVAGRRRLFLERELFFFPGVDDDDNLFNSCIQLEKIVLYFLYKKSSTLVPFFPPPKKTNPTVLKHSVSTNKQTKNTNGLSCQFDLEPE